MKILPVLVGSLACLELCQGNADPPRPVNARQILLGGKLTEPRVLEQNWTDEEARKFYNTTQGSQMMPYAWWKHLEQDNAAAPFKDEANIRSLGYLARSPGPGNPDGLPVGFVSHGVALGLTCAACHTGQINFQGKAWLIDGAPSMADAAALMLKLERALKATLGDQAKFDRFSAGVLGPRPDAAAVENLRRELKEVIDRRSQYNARNFPTLPNRGFGPGRLDAFDAIFNEVAVRFAQVSDNPTQCDAPVSYPFLWDTPQHDRVQWNGSAENIVKGDLHVGALGRNIGEVLGVFADVDTTTQEAPRGGYESSVNTGGLSELEDVLLTKLWSPQWPEALGKIDAALAGKGEVLFQKHCADCHKPIDTRNPHRKIIAQMKNVQTDQTMARNAATRTARSGIFEGRVLASENNAETRKLGAAEPIGFLLKHLAQRVLVGNHPMVASQAAFQGFDVLAEIGSGKVKVSAVLTDARFVAGKLETASVKEVRTPIPQINPLEQLPEELKPKFKADASAGKVANLAMNAGPAEPVNFLYKGRPLNGIWATAPYLHNGSVLNLDELLKPAAKRLPKFHVGSREFDPKNVGFVDDGDFELDTTQPGNSKAGHEYGDTVFTNEERAQLVEYMKTL